jgi:beta-lactamase regulating signal transducer with metallopeptidase domain
VTPLNFLMTTLLNGILEGAFLAVAMWLFLKLLPRLNPTTRFSVLWATLLAIVALLVGPFAPTAVTPGADSPANAAAYKPTPLAPITMVEPRFNSQSSDTSSPSRPQFAGKSNPKPVSDPDSKLTERSSQLVGARTASSEGESIARAAVKHPLIRIRSGGVLGAFEITWALLSFLMLTRLGFGYRKLRGLKADATPFPKEWQIRLINLSGINNVGRRTQFLVSSRVAAPMSLGFLHPAIVIPRTLVDTLSDSELEHVILHELGHLRRRDDWTNLAQKLIEALLPIQPAVYWIGHRMSIEREMACDDWVIEATGEAEPYATSLTRVAELSSWARADVLAAGATGNRSQLFSRVHHMLDRTRNAAPKLSFAPLGAAVAAIGILIYVGVRAPKVIAFAGSTAQENSRQEPISPASPYSKQAPRTPVAAQVPRAPMSSPAGLEQVAALTSTEQGQSPVSPLTPRAPQGPTSPPVPLAPVAPIAPVGAQQSGETHMKMTTREGATSLSVKIDGAIEFTDDDRDIKSLSPGGHFRLEEGTWLSARMYDVKADSSGNLTKTYSVGSSVKPLDSEGQEWLGRLLPQVIRETGIGAGPRVARMLRQGGPEAVIHEIGLIHSDGSKRIYLEQLFSQANLTTEQLEESAKLIRGISSDGDKAQVLIDVDGKYFTRELRPNLFEAVESIHSDGDKRRVLSDILKKDAVSMDTLFSAARAAEHISSDGDKAEVLLEMANSYSENGGLPMAYFDAVKSISSDGDHARVLLAMLAAHGDDRGTLARVLRSAAKISSDGDKARVLEEAVPRYSDDQAISKAFMDAATSISSDGDHQRVLVALVHRQGIDRATIDEIAKSAQRISSDGDKARVLVELVGVNVEPARDDFFAAVDSIHSDGDHSHVLLTLLDKSGTSSAMAIAAIQSASRISSDGDKGRVLVDAAHRYSRDPQVDAALRKAIESLHSDSEYRRVVSEIAQREKGN